MNRFEIFEELLDIVTNHEAWPKDHVANIISGDLGIPTIIPTDGDFVKRLFVQLDKMMLDDLFMFSHNIISSNDRQFCGDRMFFDDSTIVSNAYYCVIQYHPTNYDSDKHGTAIIWSNADISIFYTRPVDRLSGMNAEIELFYDGSIINIKDNSNDITMHTSIGLFSNDPLNHLNSMYIQSKGSIVVNEQ